MNLSQYWNKRKSGTYRRSALKRKYDISEKDYSDMIKSGNGKCWICGYKPKKNHSKFDRLVIDHDHKTKKARGVVCVRCNHGLGYVDDSLFMSHALRYLEK
jgi:hypothetical protein